MTINKNWILPEGFQEILPPYSLLLETCRTQVIDVFSQHGYHLVIPPMVEFLEALSAESGNDLDLSTFKVTDQKSGRMLGVRADMTPQIARIHAHYMREEQLSRLCYIGPILLTGRNSSGVNREQMQFGAELYGSNNAYTDVEIILLAVSCLKALGIQGHTLSIGDMGIINALVRAMNPDAAQRENFYDILERRSAPDLSQFFQENDAISAWLPFWQKYFQLLGKPQQVVDALSKLCFEYQHIIKDNLITEKIKHFEDIITMLQSSKNVSGLQVDMMLLHAYDYHSGLVFFVYHPALSEPAMKGGRYEGAGEKFGHKSPAIGFSADLYQLLFLTNAVNKTHSKVVKAILPAFVHENSQDETNAELFKSFQHKIEAIREDGSIVLVELDCCSAENHAPENSVRQKLSGQRYTHELLLRDNQWELVAIN